jgi:hypothetical protein
VVYPPRPYINIGAAVGILRRPTSFGPFVIGFVVVRPKAGSRSWRESTTAAELVTFVTHVPQECSALAVRTSAFIFIWANKLFIWLRERMTSQRYMKSDVRPSPSSAGARKGRASDIIGTTNPLEPSLNHTHPSALNDDGATDCRSTRRLLSFGGLHSRPGQPPTISVRRTLVTTTGEQKGESRPFVVVGCTISSGVVA